MRFRGLNRSVRVRYADNMERRIRRLEAENAALKRDKQSLEQELQSYKAMEDQIKGLGKQYLQGIHDTKEMTKKCREMISAGRTAHSEYSKQMRRFLKDLR